MRPAGRLCLVVALSSLWAAGVAAGAKPSGILERDLAFIATEEPRLAINTGGHTAAVQALAFTPDSKRLCSGGLDKIVQVWNLDAVTRDLRGAYLRERTIRWQMVRGLRGSIYALACSPSDGLLAMGGYGAMGSLGEILLVDPVQGTLSRVLSEHRQTVASLSFSQDGQWLASTDVDGRSILWKRPEWKAEVLYSPDAETYGADQANLIRTQPRLRPVVFLTSGHVVLPVYVGREPDGRLRWQLQQIGLADRGDVRTYPTIHYGVVTALAAGTDGSRLASADMAGNLYLWDLRTPGAQAERLSADVLVKSLSFSRDGGTLAVGTGVAGAVPRSQVQVWDLAGRRVTRRVDLVDHVHAVAISPDGRRLAYVGGEENQVYVESLGATQPRVELRGRGQRVMKVAFAKDEPLYRIALGTEVRDRGFNDYGDLNQVFDPERLDLDRGPIDRSQWIAADLWSGGWTAARQADGALQLYRDRVPKGKVAFGAVLHEGGARSYCWIPDREGNPFAIAVGTDVQNSIYVCRLAEQGICPILRHFRGHHDYVTSVGVSRDLRYLVSGSGDNTVSIWTLSGYERGAEAAGRWGAEFEVSAAADAASQAVRSSGRATLAVRSIDAAGPLFGKGVRQGDRIIRIRWLEPSRQDISEETDAAAIRDRLRTLPWGTQVEFHYARGDRDQPGFLLMPAWQALATLFVSDDREWAFWTPQGYYDASTGGNTLFGWQVNRGLQLLPEFYRADQFRARLEQPGVMERLLPSGSLEVAIHQAGLQTPAPAHEALGQQIAATPRLTIVEPLSDVAVRGDVAKVVARIEIPAQRQLTRTRLYDNGVVAIKQVLISQRAIGDATELTYQWDVPLAADERHLIQLVARTDEEASAISDLVIRRVEPRLPRPPRLYLLALGINQYKDQRIPALNYSVADAEAVLESFRGRALGVYTLGWTTLLTNDRVTPDGWRQALEEIKKKLLAEVVPDDLLIIFLAGHGVEDPRTKEYYFIGHEYDLANLKKGEYAGCLSWKDFRLLEDVPCRKLAILDTCHSGAIQQPRSRNLKQAVRALQEDVIFTLTATTGEQLAAENPDWQHGVFTKSFLEALEGRADEQGDRDGLVTLSEAFRYLDQTVPAMTSSLTGKPQNPTIAPDEILPYTRVPLTQKGPGTAGRETSE